MKKYANIVFIQSSDETQEPETIYHDQGIDALFQYLKQWDYGEYHDVENTPNFGTSDRRFYIDDYIVIVNSGMPYFGLTRIIESEE